MLNKGKGPRGPSEITPPGSDKSRSPSPGDNYVYDAMKERREQRLKDQRETDKSRTTDRGRQGRPTSPDEEVLSSSEGEKSAPSSPGYEAMRLELQQRYSNNEPHADQEPYSSEGEKSAPSSPGYEAMRLELRQRYQGDEPHADQEIRSSNGETNELFLNRGMDRSTRPDRSDNLPPGNDSLPVATHGLNRLRGGRPMVSKTSGFSGGERQPREIGLTRGDGTMPVEQGVPTDNNPALTGGTDARRVRREERHESQVPPDTDTYISDMRGPQMRKYDSGIQFLEAQIKRDASTREPSAKNSFLRPFDKNK